MPTYFARARTLVGTTGTTWAATANLLDGAAGSIQATYATWTNATSGGVGTVTVGGFETGSPIGPGETLVELAVVVRNGFNNAARIQSVTAQALDNGTPIGSAIALPISTGQSSDRAVLPVSEAQIKSPTFQIRITITRKGVTQSAIWSIDWIDTEIDTALPPPQEWLGAGIGDIGVAALSGEFVYEAPSVPQTWDGSIATVGIATTSGTWIETERPQTWSGSVATLGTAGVSAAFGIGTITWAGSIATIGMLGVTGSMAVPGPPQDWGGPGAPSLPVTDGLSIWLDASQLTLADGEAVSPWPNLGSAVDAAIVGSPAPVLRTGVLNGLPIVRFTVSEGRVRSSGTGTGEAGLNWTVVYIARLRDATLGRVVGAIYSPANLLIGFWNGFENIAYIENFLTPDARRAQTTNWRLYTGTGEGVSGDARAWLYEDGVFSSGGHPVTGGWQDTLAIGGYDPTTSAETPNADVAELLFYDHRLIDAERNAVEDYLRAKWLEPVVASDVATIGVTGVSGLFTATAPPPQTWIGSVATIGTAGISGAFSAGGVTWTGSTATIGAAGTSGAFVAGARTWTGNTATVGVAGITGLFTAGAQAWAGSIARIGVAGTSGTFAGGATTWVSTSVARVGVAASSGTIIGGAITWATTSTASLGVTASSGVMVAGTAAWLGSTARIGMAGETGIWISILGGKPLVWVGTEWVAKPVKYWNGNAWVAKPMKVWTGSTWELV